MNLASLAAVPHLISAFTMDDSSLALLAMLAGMLGGWSLTGRREQLKEKRAKMDRE